MWYGYLADLVIAIHVGYIACVLGGQALTALQPVVAWAHPITAREPGTDVPGSLRLDTPSPIPDASRVSTGKGVPTVSQIYHAARAIRQKFRLMSAFGALWPAALRGGKLLARGRFREFGQKLLNESGDVRRGQTATKRDGPLLFLAGPIQRVGGYDHVVLAVLRGLTESGVNVHRDFWGLFRNELIPEHLRPAEATRWPGQPRLVVAPPHLLFRFRPDARTAAFTMWETDTLPA